MSGSFKRRVRRKNKKIGIVELNTHFDYNPITGLNYYTEEVDTSKQD